MPPNAEEVARIGGAVLRQPALRRRLQAAESRLKLPQLSAGEVVTLQKQVVTCGANSISFPSFRPKRWSPEEGDGIGLAQILLFRLNAQPQPRFGKKIENLRPLEQAA